ncbi:MAG: ABC transporter ATP-binding protein [Verrucomicrobiota bacterium]|nr:ABC transporter ATP-binding protein [Verrucomicrobiota bacterium]
MPFLELKNIEKSYGDRSILKGINLSMEEGEFVSIVGYSGMGKTTLISMIAGLVTPDKGEVVFKGKRINSTSLDRVMIFQNYSLLPWLTAQRNVELAVAQAFPSLSRKRIATKAIVALEKVKLGHALSRKPCELSGGMKQRVSLARGLAMEPQILLLDEPLGALDALTRAELQDELVRIQQEDKKTLLMITNDVDEGIICSDRIIPLSALPGATLGEAIPVTVSRPRDRKRLNHDPSYHRDRKKVLQYLLSHGPRDLNLSNAAQAHQKPIGMEMSDQESKNLQCGVTHL